MSQSGKTTEISFETRRKHPTYVFEEKQISLEPKLELCFQTEH